MSILTDLRAALDAYRHAVVMLRAELGAHFIPTRIRERDIARERLAELLIDAAPALLDVADEVARRAPFLVADPENDRLLNLAAALTRAPLMKEADHDHA